MADIIELILCDHERILRLQTALHDVARYHRDGGPRWALTSTWERLAALIGMHAEAEEEICYLAMFGTSPPGLEQMQEAIADHDDIREAIGEARLQPAGSPRWWRAVKAALSTCFEQIDREERGVLASFARRADRVQRDNLARQWSAFLTARHDDLSPQAPPGDLVPVCRTHVPLDAGVLAVREDLPMLGPYPPGFRHPALDLVESGRAVRDVTASRGIAESCLRRWRPRDQGDRDLKPGTSARETADLAAARARIRDLE